MHAKYADYTSKMKKIYIQNEYEKFRNIYTRIEGMNIVPGKSGRGPVAVCRPICQNSSVFVEKGNENSRKKMMDKRDSRYYIELTMKFGYSRLKLSKKMRRRADVLKSGLKRRRVGKKGRKTKEEKNEKDFINDCEYSSFER